MVNRRVALVLAGGKARRFQTLQQGQVWQDKALALLEGKPLLVWVVENVIGVVDEVVVCVDNEDRKVRYFKVLKNYRLKVKVVVDEKTKVKGPNAAILSGLKVTQADFCIIIPCDMPFVKSEVINYLFEIAKEYETVVPIWPNGTIETLIMVLKHSTGLEILQTLCQLKRPHPSDIPRATTKTLLVSPLKTINTLDPALKSFININTKEDLEKLQTRNTQGSIQQNITVNRGNFLISDLQNLRDAVKMYQRGKNLTAKEKIDLCKNQFEASGNFFWTAIASENKGKILLKQLQQLQKRKDLNIDQQTVLTLEYECKEAFSNATKNYQQEAKFYKKNHCTRLLERVIKDSHSIKKFCK